MAGKDQINNQKFEDVYDKLETYFDKVLNKTGGYVPFASLIEQGAKKIPGVSGYLDELRLFKDLRNLLKHKVDVDDIFTLSDQAVSDIERVYQALTQPKRLEEIFSSPVEFLNQSDKYETVQAAIRDHHYTQFPVVDKQGHLIKKMVTASSIVHACAKKDKPSVQEMLNESSTKVEMISSKASIYEAEERFVNAVKNGNKVLVLLLVKNVSDVLDRDQVVGIVTPADLPTIAKYK
jgi:predicted transcriptional regulator